MSFLPPPPARPDDLLHAAAQLPTHFRFGIECQPQDRARLKLLSRAYGIDRRVAISASTTAGVAWRIQESASGEAREVTSDEASGNASMAELIHSVWPPAPMKARTLSTEVLAGHRIAVVTNVPARYRVALLERLAPRLASADAHLRTFFLARDARTRKWLSMPHGLRFEHEFVSGIPVPIRRRPPTLPLGLERALSRFRPTMILSAGFSPATLYSVVRLARKRGAIFGIYSGEVPYSRQAAAPWRARQRAWAAREADFAVAYGALSASYLGSLSPRLPVVIGRNTSVEQATPRAAGRSPVVDLLTVGDLSSRRKGVDLLVDALRLRPDLACRLSIVGSGRQRAVLEERARGDDRIRFLGALTGSELDRLYRASDAFVFPSRFDVFGLVLVEAMAAGLPAAVSTNAGAVADVCLPDRNCLVVQSETPEAWSEAIERLVLDSESRSAMANLAWKTIAGRWTLDHAVEAMTAAFRLGALVGRRPAISAK